MVLPLLAWVGLFNLASVTTTLRKNSFSKFVTECACRGSLLLLVPAAMYVLLYMVHLQMLPNYGINSLTLAHPICAS